MTAIGITSVFAGREDVYLPETRPGFTAWVTGFEYGDGRIGVSFKETIKENNPNFIAPLLEMGEAVGAPVSYASIECGSADEMSYRVYLASDDSGVSYHETGRCQLESGSFCNVGFPDGRIIGFDVPRINESRTGWCDYIEVRESTDGGTTWTQVDRLLEGTAPYLWRVRRMHDGTIVILASLYGTPWGRGRERNTRNTMLPGESYLNKIQSFFLTSQDGREFTGPHYVLPGIGAHEFDVIEIEDDSLLFVAGDVQGTPTARQIVKRVGNRFLNGSLLPIRLGAPVDPSSDPQGGYVPETMARAESGLIVGSRRGKSYSVSNDLGENWHPVENLPVSLYQPFMMSLPDGQFANFGHLGGDSAFGQEDMRIGVDRFAVPTNVPSKPELTLDRNLSRSRNRYLNAFSATLTVNGLPVPGQSISFRFIPVWNKDGSATTRAQDSADMTVNATTNELGVATVHASQFDHIGDIHFYYNVDAVYRPPAESRYSATDGPLMCVAALTPVRADDYPHPAYLAGGTLWISPQLHTAYPRLIETLREHSGTSSRRLPNGLIPTPAVDLLIESGVLERDESGATVWLESVHAPFPLTEVRLMTTGDWYV